jgi:hypothetical protein
MGIVMIGQGVSRPDRSPRPVALAGATAVLRDAGPAQDAGLAPSVPVELGIAAIGVRTPVVALGVRPDGTIAVPPPTRGAPAGWYRHLPSPGEVGPAVIVGHVDSARDGPAVFFRLRETRPGDLVTVRRLDGSVVTFAVDRVELVSKRAFPTAAVYGATTRPELRIITCGGDFDRVHQTYRSNVVVFATLVGRHARPQ